MVPNLVHEPYHRQPITVLECLPNCPILRVPVDQVDLHGVDLAIYRVLTSLAVCQAPVPVELGKLKLVIFPSWEPSSTNCGQCSLQRHLGSVSSVDNLGCHLHLISS